MSETEIKELGDKLANLTIIQAVALKDYLKEQYKIEPAAGGVVMAAGPAAAAPAAATEPTEFNVILEAGFPADKKISLIKAVREQTGLGLAEAKAFVEGAPKAVKEGVDKPTAEKVAKAMEDAGGKATIKGV
ncbi:MAG: 50S ribosomal protein L7/L12 [Zavarzinella sp.]